jgi:hypothetical protein
MPVALIQQLGELRLLADLAHSRHLQFRQRRIFRCADRMWLSRR